MYINDCIVVSETIIEQFIEQFMGIDYPVL